MLPTKTKSGPHINTEIPCDQAIIKQFQSKSIGEYFFQLSSQLTIHQYKYFISFKLLGN